MTLEKCGEKVSVRKSLFISATGNHHQTETFNSSVFSGFTCSVLLSVDMTSVSGEYPIRV